MIGLIKRPVRFVQFSFRTDSYHQKKLTIKCKNRNYNITFINVTPPEDSKICIKKSYESQIVKTKLCPNDEYDFIIGKGDTHSKTGDYTMTCEQAIYENNYLNKYKITINKKREAKCELDINSKYKIENETKDKVNNLLNENEKLAEEKIKQHFDKTKQAKEKGIYALLAPYFSKNAPLKIDESKNEKKKNKRKIPHFEQKHGAQIEKDKYILIESDEEIEQTQNNIEKNDANSSFHDLTSPSTINPSITTQTFYHYGGFFLSSGYRSPD
uniref:Ephrin n=1 Tax=Meloidogyne hapla TaxID=6305 RepID=A0A1I8BT16_MELHA